MFFVSSEDIDIVKRASQFYSDFHENISVNAEDMFHMIP